AVRNGVNQEIEIYDLAQDAGEANDLAGDRPDLVTKAASIFEDAHLVDPEWPLTGPTQAQKDMAKQAWKIKRERDANAWVPPNAEPLEVN
ncbi:MAG: N-acetylgalactosamine 6-sulfate sulfatase, partial [Verrucomicrobiota bacterium]